MTSGLGAPRHSKRGKSERGQAHRPFWQRDLLAVRNINNNTNLTI